jgi:DNA-nicking Smr family endonuclease
VRRKAPKGANTPPSSRYGQRTTQGRKRTLTAQEHALWQSVTMDATPRPGMAEKLEAEQPLDHAEDVAMSKQASRSIAVPSLRPARTQVRPEVPPLAPLDRRTSKKLVRGQLTPDATLDLHGMTRHSAEVALLRFVSGARAQGLKLALVITGKGTPGHLLHGRDFHHDPTSRSVLRNLVPALLQEPQFRTHVTGFQPAHPKHGGGGALYLWLRRHR